MKNTVLVTGAGGFIGRAVVKELLNSGHHVIAMIRRGSIPPFMPHPELEILWADILDCDSYADRVKKVDAVVHLAANKYHPKLSYAVNLEGAKNLVRLITEKKIHGKRLINISSQSTKIRYRGVYGESKRQSDILLERDDIDWTTLKPSLVYGAGKETLFQTIKMYIEKLPVVPLIGNGKWELYPIDVEDLAKIIEKSINLKTTFHKVYDLGDKNKITFDDLILLIQKRLKITKPIFHLPVLLGLPAVFVATKIIKTLPVSVDNVLGSTQNTDCDPLPAIREFKVTPLSTKKGVEKYIGETRTDATQVAVVGLGKMGIMHASILNTLPHTRITALVDMDKSLGHTAQSMGILAPYFPSLTEAFANVKVDAVYICTPTFAHKELMQECEAKKIPYFVEKPLFPRYAEFKEVMGSKSNMSGYFWLYKREVIYTKNLLTKKIIGDLKSYSVTLEHGEVFGPKKGWLFVKKLSGGGVLANPGPHAFSLVEYLFGHGKVTSSKIEYLYGNEVEDKAMVSLAHPGGLTGKVLANWSVRNHPVMSIGFYISGSKGSIEFKNDVLTIKFGKKITRLSYTQIPSTHEVFNLNPRSGGDAYYIEDDLFIKSIRQKTTFTNSVPFAKSVEGMIEEAYAKAH